mgnify:CR=1 FL=1
MTLDCFYISYTTNNLAILLVVQYSWGLNIKTANGDICENISEILILPNSKCAEYKSLGETWKFERDF